MGSDPRAGTASTRYEILGRLAEGGMAEIFLARSEGMAGLERHVVLKRVLPERARNHAFVAMFLDEARLAAQLHHPNIAQVYDIGRLGESYFFTMEYVHGENVRELLARLVTQRRQLAIGDALTIVAGVAAGLHHAHERRGADRRPLGIVHRDISPSNILVSYEGSVKVVDFGIAKANERSNAADTRTGSVKGKVAYMSPEQCKGKELDRRSDIFSLGIVLWELCTGQRLFKYDTDFDAMSAIVYNETPLPSHLRPGVPAEVDRICTTAMAKDADRRFATAAEMLEAIETVAVRTGHPLSTTALGRTIRGVFGDRPEPWIALEEPAPSTSASHPVTVTGDVLVQDIVLEEAVSAVAVGASPITPASILPPPAATLATGPSVDELLRQTAPIPRATPADLDPMQTLPMRPVSPHQLAAQAQATPAAVPGERIATRRGHVPAHRVRAAQRVSSSPVGTGSGSGSGSQPNLSAMGSAPPEAPQAPASSSLLAPYGSSSITGTSATADIIRQTRRSWGPIILIAAIIIAFGGLALAYFVTK